MGVKEKMEELMQLQSKLSAYNHALAICLMSFPDQLSDCGPESIASGCWQVIVSRRLSLRFALR